MRSGFVAVAGRPNVGKSTLVNALAGEKVAIVSDKPQTTRRRISAVVNGEAQDGPFQLVLVDLPGFQRPRDALTERMQRTVDETLADVDAFLFVLAATERIGPGDRFIAERVFAAGPPVVIALNKVDRVDPARIAEQIAEAAALGDFHALHPVSALRADGLDPLLHDLVELLPEGPAYFEEGTRTDLPLEARIAEIVREKALALTREEVPHAITVEVDELDPEKGRVRALVWVETESQKGILIGKGGSMIKTIGTRARQEIEALLGRKVFLDLGVKVRPRWRKDAGALERLGIQRLGGCMAVVRTPDEFEAQLARFLYERSEEARAVRVGEKESSEQAAIVARYDDLFSREQHDALRAEEEGARGEGRERLYRLREACAGGIVVRELADESDSLENAILAERVVFRGESLPLRSAQAQLAVLDDYEARRELGDLVGEASAGFNDQRYALMRHAEALEAELSGEPDPVRRSAERKAIDLHALARALADASARQVETWQPLRDRWLDLILGAKREDEPDSYHVAYLRRMSPLADLYARDRAVPVSLETLSSLGLDLAANDRIRLDLDDRPQKNPRACVIASDPPSVVHLITRAQGGLHDYQALLHEAGHALHYAGIDPDLPYTFRRLSRDHALTEIYSFLLESITREPGWHAMHFGLSDEEDAERAEAARFLEVLLYRRYAAKLEYELELWADFENAAAHAQTYADKLREAIGFRYRPDGYLADLDGGFYSADYLRAWIRTAQLRAYLRERIGEDWWRRPETGEILRDLWAEGTRPTSEEIADRIGFDPLDTAPLLDELVPA